jgi:hypothetical protein
MGSASLCLPARPPTLVRCSAFGRRASLARPTAERRNRKQEIQSTRRLSRFLSSLFVLRIGIFHAFNLLSNKVDLNDGIDQFA